MHVRACVCVYAQVCVRTRVCVHVRARVCVHLARMQADPFSIFDSLTGVAPMLYETEPSQAKPTMQFGSKRTNPSDPEPYRTRCQ